MRAVGMRTEEKVRKVRSWPKSPSFLLEYTYYFVLCYSMLGEVVGVAISLVGPGLLAGLAVLSVMHFGQRILVAYRPVIFALGCALSVLLLQLVVHAEEFSHVHVRAFVTWLLSLLVIQSISWREGFIHRFAIVAFFIGCATLPFLKVYVDSEAVVRVGLDKGVSLSNPNSFAMWFGFCAVYFLIAGLKARHNFIRAGSWLAGILCLYLVGITVSRGPLIGVAIAVAFGFKEMLKRSFLPIIGLLFMGWIIYVSGVFDNVIGYYTERGGEESGRSFLWATGFHRFMDSWLVGVGFTEGVIALPYSGVKVTPHNALIFLALSSGVIPLILFIGYIVRTGRAAFRSTAEAVPESAFFLPMFVFALMEMMILDTAFMSPWFMVVVSMILSEKALPPGRRMKNPQIARR